MPDREDHRDRTGKAIAAFLGEPVAQKAGPPAQRRRHRARRPNGDSGSRTGVVLALGGGSTPPRVVRAVASALRDTVRESDEIVELTGGRIRISLESDDAGSEAFVARARTIVSPWLELLGPDLELRLEPPGSLPSRTSAAS